MKKLVILLLILTSCGPNYKLRKAKRLIYQAQMQGAVLRNDTIYTEKKIEVKGDSTIITLDHFIPCPDSIPVITPFVDGDGSLPTWLGSISTVPARWYHVIRDTTIYDHKIKIRVLWKDGILKVSAQCPDTLVTDKSAAVVNQTIECPPPNHTWRTVALSLGGVLLLLLLAFFVGGILKR